jgi:hypothetical protein
MASTSTGEMYTQEQFDAMSVQERADLGMVRIDPSEQKLLQPMTLEERKAWLAENKSKKPSRRVQNKKERQNRKLARRRS